MRLQGKIAIVTGGASGMGESTSELFAQEGAAIVIADIDGQRARDLASRIGEAGGHAVAVEMDLADEPQVLSMVAETMGRFHRVDILVNCVGIAGAYMATEQVSLNMWRRVIDVDLTGVFLCCREVGKIMIAQRSGKIVNFASTIGLSGGPYIVPATAAKHGVVGLTRGLAVEWGKYNIHVNCICPGATLTPQIVRLTSEEYRAERARRVPLGRLGKPEEQARVALFLASSESDYVSGAIVCVDGGMYALSPATSTDALEGKF